MAIASAAITTDQIRRLLNLEEGHFADLKRIEVTPAKLSQSIAAFANADGDELFIGVDETISAGAKVRTWRGFASEEDANGHLQAFEALFPLGQDFSYEFLRMDDLPGVVLHLEIQKTSDIKTATNGAVYVRRGAQNLPVPEGEPLERLKRNKGITSFENATVDGPLEAVTDSYAITEFMVEVVPTSEPEPWLRKQLLVEEQKPREKIDIPPIPEFIGLVHDSGVHLYACKASVDMFALTMEDFVPQVEDIISVGEFYEKAAGGQIIFT